MEKFFRLVGSVLHIFEEISHDIDEKKNQRR